ncbi:hypothetical protein FPOAC2_07561 [Fusarium poae]|uniref:hypothetical protein n=1 Tax=Fusarium poae TaxID=36050 RepID=UPI001CEB5321|nr:hypothetical protein FPOAC1_007648 [Fusarium poae]KAG8668269.1 hypothetical protein FPOAC1_007648 [Fusarium poae]
MHFSTVTAVVLGALCTGTQAWQITAYNNVNNCKANRDSSYQVISGANNNDGCMTFGQGMGGVNCRQYYNGGSSNGACTGTPNVRSLLQEAGRCVVYDQANCKGRYQDSGNLSGRSCASLERYNWGPIRSFWCTGYVTRNWDLTQMI